MQKKRLTVTVDPALVKAGTTAVRRGLARSLSDWANAALEARAREDERAHAAALAVAAYEAEHGAFSDAELASITEDDASARRVVAQRPRAKTRRSAGRAA
jgi:hypothetical protein